MVLSIPGGHSFDDTTCRMQALQVTGYGMPHRIACQTAERHHEDSEFAMDI